MDQLHTQTDYEFAGFRLDTVLQVLIAPSGEPIALPARAYDALHHLVGRAGELVDKAALMRAIWPHTVVEDNNLNQCILTLRRALGETAGERRFILTVPGRGFKFVAPVRAIPAIREPPPDTARRDRFRAGLVVGSIVLAAGILVAAVFMMRSSPITIPTEYVALTDLSESAQAPALSPDGRMLAFIKTNSLLPNTGQIYVKQLPDGEPTPATPVLAGIYGPTFSPDGTHVAFSRGGVSQGRFGWDTWTVPVTGGEPTLLLSNAAGLTWIERRQLLYSEIRTGIHLGVVTSADNRTGHRDVYLPAHERGMAHYSYLSPDRGSVLVVEMDGSGEFRQCRLLPFDGHSAGRLVGPLGSCLSAAWSPDGRWMYFSILIDGHSHLWRQRFPDGEQQQVTFGPTNEVGVAVAPDGRSLVTSLGLGKQSLWIHDPAGDRRISSDTAVAPWLSPDARRLYFLSGPAGGAPSELWRLDIGLGQREPLLQGVSIVDYCISPDERQVVYSVKHGEMQVWLAPLDHHSPPRLLAHGADRPAIDRYGHVFYRLLGDQANYLYRIQQDGNQPQRMLDQPIVDILGVSPTGKWATLGLVRDTGGTTAIVDLGSGKSLWTRAGYWPALWAPDGNALYLSVEQKQAPASGADAVLAVKLAADAPPQIPALPVANDATLLPHSAEGFAPGPDPGTYVFTRTEQLQNIYRIPLHR